MGQSNVSKLGLSPFALCRLMSKAIEVITDCYVEKYSPRPGLVGGNNNFYK